MRRLSILISLAFLIPMSVSAYSVSCSGIPDASGCQQCFHFDLASSNAANDIFVPRNGIPAGQQEYIDLTKSSITWYVYQGANVSPTGNMTNNFDRLASGPNATASWLWAKTKPGQGIIRNSLPATLDYSKPVYAVKYSVVSHLKTQSNSTIVPGSEVSHLECGFFYAVAPVVVPPSATCGNGQKEGTEQCDDGNTNNNDGCSNACRLPVCGNGVREGVEECDDGNTRNGDSCTSQCRNAGVASVCGNGIREGSEECDDGNASNTDLCSTTCRVLGGANPQCRVQAFDAYGWVPLTTTLSCSGEPRGRTVIIITKNNTLVDTSETTSKTFTFNQSGRYTIRCYPDAASNQSNSCTTVINVDGQCGNGLVEHGEMCDDGNTISGDSCDRSCRLTGTTCGNGLLENGEMCDDGNNSNNDTCTNICQTGTPDTGPLGMITLLIAVALIGSVGIVYYKHKA
jgi:cysteine-rich repeat protein